MVTHSSRKDHECKLCGASFRTKGSLIRHHRRHTGEPALGLGPGAAQHTAAGPGGAPAPRLRGPFLLVVLQACLPLRTKSASRPRLTPFSLQMSVPISVPSVERASASRVR